MRTRRLLAASAALLTLALSTPAAATPAEPPPSAQPAALESPFQDWFTAIPLTVNGTYTPLVGFSECGPDLGWFWVLWYAPGTAADSLWVFDGESADALEPTSRPLTVNGTFTPVTGDFDDDGCVDVLWYAPGSASDSIWWGEPDGSFTAEPLTINGTYTPVVGRFAPTLDACWCTDVFWYSTTGGTEHIWLGSPDRTFTSAVAPQVTRRDYRVSADWEGSLLFHGPGAAPDHVWRGVTAGSTTPAQSLPITLDGDYELHNVLGGVLLYAPGPATDRFTFAFGEAPPGFFHGTINGRYRVGTFSPAFHGDVIVFHAPGPAPDSLWIFTAWD